MKKTKIMAILLASAVFLICGTGCELTPIEARTFEEIRGTYKLIEYHEKLGQVRTELMDNFEYFYIIIGDDYFASVVYKDAHGNDYYACELGYSLKYRSGSTEDINEIKDIIKAEIQELNKKLPIFKQIRGIEIRKTEFEKTTSRKIKRHVIKY